MYLCNQFHDEMKRIKKSDYLNADPKHYYPIHTHRQRERLVYHLLEEWGSPLSVEEVSLLHCALMRSLEWAASCNKNTNN